MGFFVVGFFWLLVETIHPKTTFMCCFAWLWLGKQYIPRLMYNVQALFCLVVVRYWSIYPFALDFGHTGNCLINLSSWGCKSLMTLSLGSSKINTVADFTAPALLRPQSYRLNFLLCWNAPWVFFLFFFRSSMCFRVPHLCSKIPKIYNWSME